MPSPKPPFLLSPAQMRRLPPHFPLSLSIPRADDRRVLSGILSVIRHGLRWCDAPAAYGPYKTLSNRFVRVSRMGVFDRIFAALATEGGLPARLMIASTHLKAHRTAASLLKKGLFPAASGDTQGRADLQAPRRPRRPGTPHRAALLTEGQASDHRGAAIMLPRLPPARDLIADRDYDSACLTALRALPLARTGLQTRGITPCIPSPAPGQDGHAVGACQASLGSPFGRIASNGSRPVRASTLLPRVWGSSCHVLPLYPPFQRLWRNHPPRERSS